MSELNVINKSSQINTILTIKEDFIKLGLKDGMTVIVHSSLSSIGWVSGGPVAVVQALMDVVTENGTIIMPTHSPNLSDPSYWENPPVPKEWWAVIRDTMPAFDPQITPTWYMGKIVEAFRTFPNVVRSYHPMYSFAAWGKNAENITKEHSLNDGLGEKSPLARVYDLNGDVLLLGVDYENNTSFHLSENRVPILARETQGAPIIENDQRGWKTFSHIDMDSDCFNDIGIDFEKDHHVNVGEIGQANAKLFKQKECVDFAEKWLAKRNEKG
ncbi:aminoglycoside N(3)-acetyltransferase [Chengkuizengella axinellae]|uniref:Aminoglycoside N(3)-acetyltransferase n=1 Tax=Chengkuizengella axinellae TaxID=3064388 RepID=A0ABT9IZS7_9BACL|nr:AAC(3) family N-acetyltransferase [Chengkuizengella sp. 2205SS18-9]MDP5274289.1 AAC(3) family N-acetyltransferase [Chengkuizengella sp. 2205SS18-9]